LLIPMVSRSTKHQILDVLQSIAEGENKIEVLRQVLAEKYNFEPYTAFKRLALAPSSNLTSTDLKDFLADNKVFISSGEAYDLLRALDLDRDGRISYSEFLKAVLPKTDSSLRQRATNRSPTSLEDGRLPFEVEYGLARIFEEELNSLQRVESLKRSLNLTYDFTSGRAFTALDYDAKNFLIPEDLADFSDELGRPLNDKDIDAIIRRLDVDQDGRVSYSEYLNGFSYPSADISSPRSSSRLSSSPRRGRARSPEPTSPVKSTGLKDLEYRDYLNESRRRSASPRRSQNDDVYATPTKSPRKLEEASSPLYSSKKKSPLRLYEEEELVKAFKDVISSSRLLESAKNDLALRFDFNLYDAYRYFDFYGTGAYISSKQFEQGLADLGVFPTRDQVSLFFKRFDTDYDGLLRY
jgi:Ca2+-binding EF-hand superfamily protein